MYNLIPEDHVPASPGSNNLLAKVQHYDEDAWNRLGTLYKPLIVYWCKTNKVNKSDQNEVFQGTMNTIWNEIGSFKVKIGRNRNSFRKWVKTIALDLISGFAKPVKPGNGEDENAAELEILENQILKMVEKETKPSKWTMFYESTIMGEKSHHVAGKHGFTPVNVRQSKHRVLLKMREEFSGVVH